MTLAIDDFMFFILVLIIFISYHIHNFNLANLVISVVSFLWRNIFKNKVDPF